MQAGETRKESAQRLLALSAVGFMLSLGLCGVGMSKDNLGFLAFVGLIGVVVSVVLFISSIIGFITNR